MPNTDTRPEPGRQRAVDPAGTRGPGMLAGRYELLDIIGRGGFGVVHRALDVLTGDVVAVKLLRELSPLDLRRLRREIASLRLLRIPGVVRLLDEGEVTDGPTDFERYLVMELVEGRPFPGDSVQTWLDLAPTALALLETLERVHQAGVVHRDLKPANVLVTPTGAPVLLDFGLSLGSAVGDSATAQGMLVGTPAYLAPEQVLGERGDVRSDLYAVGVMLYEALAGRPPHTAPNMPALMQAKVLQVPPPLRTVAPHVTPHVADVVDRLLAAQPHHRPASAAQVVAGLAGTADVDPRSHDELPWLGSRFPIDLLVASARASRSADITGPAGTGRTRVLREAARILAAERREIVWLRRGRLPFSSLDELTLPGRGMDELSLDAAVAQVRAHMTTRLAGCVVIADDWDRVDRWTASLLGALRDAVPVLRSLPWRRAGDTSADDAVTLAPLQATDLAGLFGGPQRLFHVPEDAATELHRRTEGRQVAVARELAAWVRAGLARIVRGQYVLDREAIDHLRAGVQTGATPELDAPGSMLQSAWAETQDQPAMARVLQQDPHLREFLAWLHMAWPHTALASLAQAMAQPAWQLEALILELEDLGAVRRLPDGRLEPAWRLQREEVWSTDQVAAVHRALAAALPPGTERRLYHLVCSGQLADVGAEAIVRARALVATGRLGEATALLQVALRTIRDHEAAHDPPDPWPLLHALVDLAHAEGTVRALELALYEVRRAGGDPHQRAHVVALCEAAVAALTGGGADVLAQVEDVSPFAEPALEIMRQSMRVRAVRACPLAREVAVLDDILAWAEVAGGDAPMHAAAWLGRLRYRQGRYDEAAALHTTVARSTLPPHLRLTALTNAATALQSAQRYAQAKDLATQALNEASALRHAYAAARAEWILRALDYRNGRTQGADLELVDAMAHLGVPYLRAQVAMTEALAAWRAGDLIVAAQLAQVAIDHAARVGMRSVELTSRLILALARRQRAPDLASAALDFARGSEDPEVAIQFAGLAAMVSPPTPVGVRLVSTLLTHIAPDRWHARLDLISPAEAMIAAGAALPSPALA